MTLFFTITSATVLHLISHLFVGTSGQACGVIDWGETSFDTLIGKISEVESFGVAFVNGRTETDNVLTGLKTNSSGQFISVYLTKHQIDNNDIIKQQSLYFRLQYRCQDGSSVSDPKSFTIYFVDSNNRAPEFGENSYTYFITLPWPGAVPITQANGIIVRDKDFEIENAQLSFSVSRPDLVTSQTTTLSSNSYSYDYKVDLFLTSSAAAGNYTFSLEASDGVHRTTSWINLVVTDATCRATRNPVFGNAGIKAPIIYKAVLKEFSKVGTTLTILDGLKIVEAYGPDEECQVELSVNLDYLKIDSTGNLVLARMLTLQELDTLKPFAQAEITAIVRNTQRMTKVPLILTSA